MVFSAGLAATAVATDCFSVAAVSVLLHRILFSAAQ
jgi:hypothetical protein